MTSPTERPVDLPLRIALVDDQPLVRAGFAMVIDSQDDMEVVVQASDGAEAVRELRGRRVDVVLMDVRMPHKDGIEATAEILADLPPERAPRIIVLTTFDLDEYVVAAIRAGASGFLLKDAAPEDLVRAVRVVAAGDALLDPSVTGRVIAHFAAQKPRPPRAGAILAQLTEREREVLVRMARGMSNAEVAADLFIAEQTVKTHVGKLLAKIGARDRVQAVIFAYDTGLAAPSP